MVGGQNLMGASTHSRESSEMLRDVTNTNTNSSNEEKKGLFGKWKAKMSERSEQKKLEKERAKSPPAPGQGQSRTSLSSTVASANQGPRGRSMDASRGSQSSTEGGPAIVEAERSVPTLETVTERPQTEARERADMSGLEQSQAGAIPPVPVIARPEAEKPTELVEEKPVSDVANTTTVPPAQAAARDAKMTTDEESREQDGQGQAQVSVAAGAKAA